MIRGRVLSSEKGGVEGDNVSFNRIPEKISSTIVLLEGIDYIPPSPIKSTGMKKT